MTEIFGGGFAIRMPRNQHTGFDIPRTNKTSLIYITMLPHLIIGDINDSIILLSV